MIYDQGKLLNPNFRDYKMLTAMDALPVEPIIVETPTPPVPTAPRASASPAWCPTAPAIANAIYDAVGIRMHKLPIKPEKVLRALREAEGRGF